MADGWLLHVSAGRAQILVMFRSNLTAGRKLDDCAKTARPTDGFLHVPANPARIQCPWTNCPTGAWPTGSNASQLVPDQLAQSHAGISTELQTCTINHHRPIRLVCGAHASLSCLCHCS